ncbi:MAG: hypothetical protein ACRDKF_10485, partial [Actinomycetota bacterium]
MPVRHAGIPLSPPSSPPRSEDGSRGGGNDWVELFRAANDIEAALLLGKLADAAVETRSIKDRNAPGTWVYGGSNPWAAVMIYVRRLQLIDARIDLAEDSLEIPEEPSVEDRRSRRRVPRMWWATALALGIALSAIAVQQAADQRRFCQLPILCT